jgi:predicted porin
MTLALTAPAVSAQDAVTLYGRFDLNLTRISGSPLQMSEASSSRLGLRGREQLGDTLSASFQLESAFAADTGTAGSRFWGRESWIGASGPLGAFRAGRSRTPSQRLASAHDSHDTDGIGSLGSGALLIGHARLVRFENAVFFESAEVAGLSLSAARQLAEGAPGFDSPTRSIRLRYAGGFVDASIASATLDARNHVVSFGASLGTRVKAMLQWHAGERDARRHRVVLAGATASFGQDLWRLAWSESSERGRADPERTLLALGVDHALSSRTLIYGTAARDEALGRPSKSGFEFGLRHAF